MAKTRQSSQIRFGGLVWSLRAGRYKEEEEVDDDDDDDGTFTNLARKC